MTHLLTDPHPVSRRALAREMAESRFGELIDSIIDVQPQIATAAAHERAQRALLDYTVHAILMPLDIETDPLYHYDNSSVRDPVYVLRIINLRSNLLSFEELLEDSADPYVTVRESWLQNREFEIHDGDPPVSEEEDDLFDEFFEDEDY